ncbi:MAG: HAD family hydrolase [Sedimentisphaerales bacterium]|nr:HAD family hydrolase [Sedimentisphaerales bacterium]
MKIKAVLFDMDGTLTKPYLDFDLIRSEIGNVTGPILEAMEKMPPENRKKAQDILHRHEKEAAENSYLNPGVAEVCDWLRHRDIKIGLITRNQLDSVNHFCRRHHLSFDSIVTREDGPVKPDPFGVLHSCEHLTIQPREAIVVGDYLFDLISAKRAGAHPVLLTSQDTCNDYCHEADYVISTLNELPQIIDNIEKESVKQY